jgi:hypothetical protein
MGIEPTSEAWEASILPLYDARSFFSVFRLYITARLRVQTGHGVFAIPTAHQNRARAQSSE